MRVFFLEYKFIIELKCFIIHQPSCLERYLKFYFSFFSELVVIKEQDKSLFSILKTDFRILIYLKKIMRFISPVEQICYD